MDCVGTKNVGEVCVDGCLGCMPSSNKMVSRMEGDGAATNKRRAGREVIPVGCRKIKIF